MSDGCYQKEGVIEHRSRGQMSDPSADCHVILGQSVQPSESQTEVAPFQLGNVMVYRGM